MALSFPLSYAQFFAGLRSASVVMDLTDNDGGVETAGGEGFRVSTGPRLWEMAVGVARASWDDMGDAVALVDLLRRVDASFMGGPSGRDGPRADPTGSILGAATPTLASVAGNMRDIGLAGLPAGYVLSRGDFLSFEYGGLHALHRCVGAATASGAGAIAAIEVDPVIQPGWVADAAVRLVSPRAKFRLVSKGVSPAKWVPGLAEPFAFTARQTLA